MAPALPRRLKALSPPRGALPVVRRWLRRVTTGTTTTALVLVLAPLALSAGEPGRPAPPPASPTARPVVGTASDLVPVGHRTRHPNRIIKRYRVRPGDTPTSIAVRYHAWTAQLISMNHGPRLYVGEVIRVPVVPGAQRDCTRHRHHRTNVGGHGPRKHRPAKAHHKPKKQKKHKKPTSRPWRTHRGVHVRGWHHETASRSHVRRVVAGNARHFDVNPDLALAIAWQESGWQQRRVSSAGALGAMQVLPGTAAWMSDLVGYRLNPRDLRHNATAGVRLIRWLRDNAGLRRSIAGYYQGLGGVRKHGMYPSTRRYVADVLALRRSIARGGDPH